MELIARAKPLKRKCVLYPDSSKNFTYGYLKDGRFTVVNEQYWYISRGLNLLAITKLDLYLYY
jgi:hypothetical protein